MNSGVRYVDWMEVKDGRCMTDGREVNSGDGVSESMR